MKNSYQAEAAMLLEQMAAQHTKDEISYYQPDTNGESEWNMKSIFDGILTDLRCGTDAGVIAMRFHRSFVNQLVDVIDIYSQIKGSKRIILTGGVLQNKLLSELLIDKLQRTGYNVFYPAKIPCNDGGIAVGQLASVAAMKHKLKEYA